MDDNSIKLGESMDNVNSNVKLDKEYEGCSRCLVLQDKCALMESDIGKKISLIKGLEDKIKIMESESLEVEDVVRVLKQRNEELEKGITVEEDKVLQLMIENRVVECEKSKAESDVEAWKTKFKELEMQVMQLEKSLSAGNIKTGTPIDTPFKHGVKEGHQLKSRVKKSLDFTIKGDPHQQISPLTPAGRSPIGPINISDSDDDLHTAHEGGKKVQSSADVGLGTSPGGKESIPLDGCTSVPEPQTDEKELPNCCIKRAPSVLNSKRRKVRRQHMVSSESESDCDNIPICHLGSKRRLPCSTDNLSNERSTSDLSSGDRSKELPARRCLKRLGYSATEALSGKPSCKSTKNQNIVGECESKEDGDSSSEGDSKEYGDSSSEGDSSSRFIVQDSDVSESKPPSHFNDLSEDHVSEKDESFSADSDAYESSVISGYRKILSHLQRERQDKTKWANEGEMCADFGKHSELCMKAVCTLYRQQTCEEKSFKATIHRNGRGFNQIDAFSGSTLAVFLTKGDPQSDVKKSVEELQEFDKDGIDKCWKLATHYSQQLFEIYQNKEDPIFHP